MSYDLYMLDPEGGAEPYEQLERFDEEERSTPPNPIIEARKRRIVDALRQADPKYEESLLDYEVIAEQEQISLEEAQARHRSIQLMAEGGLEINLYDQHADFNFPYWESLDAGALTADIERAAAIIAAETGWKLYDPQLEKFIDPSTHAAEVRGMFDYGRGKLQEFVAAEDERASRPLWKRFLGRD